MLVHGLWMNGMDMSILAGRLRGAGYITRKFSYRTVRATPAENAKDLQAFVRNIESDTVHFVCHSLGGLVVRHLFHQYPSQKPGRIVTLGTQHQGSSAAGVVSRFSAGRLFLGKSTVGGLLNSVPAWNSANELGSIAGTLRFGLGILVPGVPVPNDGTVSVEETRLEGMADHVLVNASHFGLLLSGKTSIQCISFLKTGRFNIGARARKK